MQYGLARAFAVQVQQKLKILADAAKYDASCASSGARRSGTRDGLGSTTGVGICHSYTPDGRCISLLKLLLTNYCIYDCKYCVNRVSSNVERARFAIDEVVNLTLAFYRRNYIEGLFLSSGIIRDVDYTMEQLTAVARCLREQHRFNGYIHLKAVPGASAESLRAAGTWADRLSANIELPTQGDLDALAPAKRVSDVTTAMREIRDGCDAVKAERAESRKNPRVTRLAHKARRFAPAGQSTQMIVGATASTDATILETATSLYTGYKLRRVYYSAFSPIPDASPGLPGQAPPLVREHRLYQADWLIRFYGFSAAEITTPEEPNLDLAIDPKLAWALRHRAMFPLDINRASRELLLRVPGLGARNVERIVAARRFRGITTADLRRLRVPLTRTLPFVVTADHNAATRFIDSDRLRLMVSAKSEQLPLFAPKVSALTGEL